MYSIGIDIGTTNCKLCVYVLPSLSLIDSRSFVTPKIVSENGSDFDVITLYQQLERDLIDLMRSLDRPDKVKNIVVASVGESGVLIDEQDQIVGSAITWYDTRTKQNLTEIQQQFTNEELYAITGIPIHSNYSLAKILWLREHYQLDCTKLKWLCMAEYIAYQLSGVKQAELSLASRTQVLDLNHQSWSSEIENKFSLANLFCELSSAGKNRFKIKPDLAKKLNNLTDIYISIGGHDHMCGAIAARLTEGEILNSTGTTEGLLILTKQAHLSKPFLDSHLSNGIFVLEQLKTLYASLPSAGYSIEWFRKTFVVDDNEFQQLLEQLTTKLTDLNYIKSSINIFIPHLRGSGPPKRNIAAKGLWYGFSDNTDKEKILFTIFQGLCFELRQTLENIESLTNIQHHTIKVIGAAAKSPVWLQLKADILGRKIVSCHIQEAVCKGAVMLAGYKNGNLTGSTMTPSETEVVIYQPNQQITAYYTQIFHHYYKPIFELKTDLELQNRKEIK